MTSPLIWIGVGIVVYTILALFAKWRGWIPDYITVQGPLTTIHTQYGKQLLDRMASRTPTLWRYWGNFGVLISLLMMVGAAAFVIQSAFLILFTQQEKTVSDPANVLVIPGVNDFLPLAAAPGIIFGLVVGLVIHEGGHGLYCRYGDIEIESLGVALLAFVPLGAFVEPDEEDSENAPHLDQLRMFSAGVTNNVMFSLVLFILLFGPLSASFAPAPGAPVGAALSDTPAESAGIGQGDVIQAVNGTQVNSSAEFDRVLRNTEQQTVTVTMRDGDTKTVTRDLLIGAVVQTGDEARLEPGEEVRAVNGEPVNTTAQLQQVVEGSDKIEVTTADGDTRTINTGAYVTGVADDSPLADTGLPSQGNFLITEYNGVMIESSDDILTQLSESDPGDQVTITVLQDGEERSYNITIAEHPEDESTPFLGVSLHDGIGRIQFTDFGVDPYPAEEMLALIQGGDGLVGFAQYIVVIVFLPLLGRINPEIGYNFAGFAGGAGNYFTVVGPLEPLGGLAFTLFNLTFWSAWINIQLGFVNCIPSYPLDGGHILRATLNIISESGRIPLEEETINSIARYVTAVLLILLAVLIFS